MDLQERQDKIDISEDLLHAIYRGKDWSFVGFPQTLDLINSLDYTISFWYSEENWATILDKESVIGYVWKKYPFAFFKLEYKDRFIHLASKENLNIVWLKNFVEDLLFIEPSLASKCFDFLLPKNCYSVEDLWFASNSN